MEEILKKLEDQETKLDEIYATVRKIKIYFTTMFILSFVTVVLPLIALTFVIPWFLRTIGDTYQGLL